MKYQAFWNALARYQQPTRNMVLTPGDIGAKPVTKIGGVPWWPAGTERPYCAYGHAMSFMMQIRLSDVPALGPDDPGLLSFHYCQVCMYEGRAANPGYSCNDEWEWDDDRCDLRIFAEWIDQPVDNRGVIAEDVLQPHRVELIERLETPGMDDIEELPEVAHLLPEDWFDEEEEFLCICGGYPFDKDQYSGCVHIPSSKIGGWPSWVQHAEWPEDAQGNHLVFVGQIDWIHGERAAWGGGGYAYLFVERPSPTRLARWVEQDT